MNLSILLVFIITTLVASAESDTDTSNTAKQKLLRKRPDAWTTYFEDEVYEKPALRRLDDKLVNLRASLRSEHLSADEESERELGWLWPHDANYHILKKNHRGYHWYSSSKSGKSGSSSCSSSSSSSSGKSGKSCWSSSTWSSSKSGKSGSKSWSHSSHSTSKSGKSGSYSTSKSGKSGSSSHRLRA